MLDDLFKLNYEKEVTGLYISGHPYESHQEKIKNFTNCKISNLSGWQSEAILIKPCFGGLITSLKEKNTKKGDTMCILQLDDSENNIDVVIFPDKWKKLKEKIKIDTACIIEGSQDDRGQILLDNIILESEINSSRAQKYVKIKLLDNSRFDDMNAKKFLALLGDCKGKSKVILEMNDNEETCFICVNDFPVDPAKLSNKINEMPSGILELEG